MFFFKTPKADAIAERQREDAERAALEHEGAAEHHQALAQMYRARITRLQGITPTSTPKFKGPING